ncbi:MAG: PAS domain S-box protein [Deltaproteobacteria bacterium]|nr:PAS domain S-box protein [Deltaproteobacteria bacterium]
MDQPLPLYNSRIVKTFVQYISEYYPDVNVEDALEYAGMTRYEVDDPAHWFNQRQVDRFHDILVVKTQNQEIAREAGRFTVSSRALGAARQYTLGFLSPMSVYLLMGRLYPLMSRGASVRARRLGSSKVEIEARPHSGVEEKPYQCRNRLGTLEALTEWFTGKPAAVEQPSCVHSGDDACRYVITWEKTPCMIAKGVRNTLVALGVPAAVGGLFVFPGLPWGMLLPAYVSVCLAVSLYLLHTRNRELTNTIKLQGNAANELLHETNLRYNTSLLVEEIGQVTSTLTDIEVLAEKVIEVIRTRLKYDRAMIMVGNSDKSLISHIAGYGYSPEQEDLLKETEFHLDNPESEGPIVLAFKRQKPFLLDNLWHKERNLSARTREFIDRLDVRSLVCVPIVYENESLGILAVDNLQSKRPLTQSDVSVLTGVASQTAVSMNNALSFRKLQQSEKKYRELVENANSIILRMDPGGRILFFNEFAQQFFGYDENTMLGRNVIDTILPDTPEARRQVRELVDALEREPWHQRVREIENVLRGGGTAWVAWTFRPTFRSDGRLQEILCIGNDITELRDVERDREALQKQLLVAQKMEAVGTLAGGIAHDFNNILQAIYGYTQILLMERGPEDPAHAKLRAIGRSVERASELIKRLLIFGRKVESRLRPADLNREVMQVVEMLERTIPKMIEICFHPEDNLHIVNADTIQVEQILMNLGINARDAMPEGGRLVFETANVMRVEAGDRENRDSVPKPYVRLTVSDTGTGMDRETVDRMFEPFFTTKEQGKGSGLGLAMVYGIVKSHGGEITCESEPGQGSTFKIFFPALGSVPAGTEVRNESLPARGSGETVLLVDDEEVIRALGKEILHRYGYTVLLAKDGEEALWIYDRSGTSVDLIILDLIMPGMGGVRCLEALLDRDPRAKVIISSGYALDEASTHGIEGKTYGFIPKPYDFKQMLDVVKDALAAD